MKRKRAIGYTLLIIANMLLLAHVFMPHHHHNNWSYCVIEHQDCGTDHQTTHNHTNAEKCFLDLMVVKFSTSSLNLNTANQLYLPSLFKYQFKPQINIVCYLLAPHLCVHYFPIMHPVFNLRGPPVIV